MILLLIAIITGPFDSPAYADTVELNHKIVVRERFGVVEQEEVLVQWIVWDWYFPNAQDGRQLHVWCWRIGGSPVDVYRRGGKWVLRGRDGGPDVIADCFIETFGDKDHEAADRDRLHPKMRRHKIRGFNQ